LAFDLELHFDDTTLHFLDNSFSVLQRKSYFLHRSESGGSLNLGDLLPVGCTVRDTCLDPDDEFHARAPGGPVQSNNTPSNMSGPMFEPRPDTNRNNAA
jgi:hypothetical protein